MDIKKTIIIWIGIALVLSGVIFFVGIGNASNEIRVNETVSSAKTLTTHDPIYINGNSQFIVGQNGVTSGSGTQADPYIIENWDINASSADGIHIENTDVYFIIRNSVIHDGCNNYNYGIQFWNVLNGKIDNANSYHNFFGIYLWVSSNNNITDCNVYNNSYGIGLDYPANNKLRNNVLNNNTYNFGVYGSDISYYYQDVDTSNTINGKPIYYIIEQKGLVFDETMSIGYLGLISCSNIIMRNLTLNNNIQGILLLNTTYSTITNCAVYNNSWYGIYLSSSSNNAITNCNVYNNGDGIRLYDSSNNNITNCDVYNNSDYGIELDESSNNNIITNCNVYNNSCGGIMLYYYSDNNQITNCTVYNNDYGIYLYGYLYGSSNTEVHYNNIYNNTDYGISNWNTESQYVVNATNNWWGSASGPYHSTTNPSGNGDNVSNNVIYNPWLTAPWTGASTQPTLTITVNANPITVNSSEASTITITVTNSTTPISGATINLISNNSGSFSSVTDNGDGTYTATFTAPSVTTQTVCRITANGTKTGYTNSSNYIDVTVNPVVGNHAPIVNSITANPTGVTASGTVAITVDATDEDTGDILTYHYICTGGSIDGNDSSVIWTAPSTAGDYTITVYVNDGKVNSNSKSVSVTVTSPEKEKPKGFIPGFETFTLIMVLAGCAILLKNRKREMKK